MRQVDINKAWAKTYAVENNDHLFFASRETAVPISTLHPDSVQSFRLWQLYLDNVNPLLKVTHAPSMQRRIVEAANSILNVVPALEAFMFSVYCMAVESLDVDDCQTMFMAQKKDLLRKYQFGCQQALLNCGFLQSCDRDCLTAFYLYLVRLPLFVCITSHESRSQSDPARFPSRYHPCLALPYASHNGWVSTANRPWQDAQYSKPKCGEDYGGHSYCSILVWAS